MIYSIFNKINYSYCTQLQIKSKKSNINQNVYRKFAMNGNVVIKTRGGMGNRNPLKNALKVS